GHPLRGDDVAQVGDVIAVEVCDQYGSDGAGCDTCRHEPHHDAAAAGDEVVPAPRLDQRGRPGSILVGHRTTGAEKRDGDHWRLIGGAASAARVARAGGRTRVEADTVRVH